MSEPFDPYRKWLGIPPKDQPPNHYRLLGLAHFEDDPDVIENAATRQMAHVRTYQSGKHSALSQRVLNELTAAKLCLLTPAKKQTYDEQLRQKLAAEGKLSSDNLLLRPDVSGGAAQEEEPASEEALSTGRPSQESRWKTDTELPPAPEPPIVPIPMPVGILVPQAPPMAALPSPPPPAAPLVRGSVTRFSSYRLKKSRSSALPIAIMLVGLLILIFGGIAAVVYSGVLLPPPEKHLPKKTPASLAPGKSEKDKEAPSTTRPLEKSSSSPAEGNDSRPSERGSRTIDEKPEPAKTKNAE